MSRRALVGFGLALGAFAASPEGASADVVELATGERIEGAVMGTAPAGVVIVVHGREQTIAERRILRITFEPAPASPPTPERPAPPPSTAAREPAAAAPAAPPAPKLDLAMVSPPPLREAMRALVDLRSFAAGSISYADYAARANEAKARVDRYLKDSGEARPEVKKALASAMRLYTFASAAWEVYDAKGDLAAIGRDPTLGECLRLRQAIEQDAARWDFRADDPAFAGLIAGSEGVAAIWDCAADKIGEAEKLIAEERR